MKFHSNYKTDQSPNTKKSSFKKRFNNLDTMGSKLIFPAFTLVMQGNIKVEYLFR